MEEFAPLRQSQLQVKLGSAAVEILLQFQNVALGAHGPEGCQNNCNGVPLGRFGPLYLSDDVRCHNAALIG